MTANGLFKVTQGHRFWYRSKACMRLPIRYQLMSYLASFPSHLGVLVQIIAFARRYLYLTPSFGVNPELWSAKFAVKN